MTPALACRLRLFETVIDPPVVRFIGDPGRLGPEVMKGFVMSPAAAFECFVGDVLKMLTDAPVRGVFTSDLVRRRAGVLGV